MNWRRLSLPPEHKKTLKICKKEPRPGRFLQTSDLLPITKWTSNQALTLSHMPNSFHSSNKVFLLILSTSDVGTCLLIYDIKSDAWYNRGSLKREKVRYQRSFPYYVFMERCGRENLREHRCGLLKMTQLGVHRWCWMEMPLRCFYPMTLSMAGWWFFRAAFAKMFRRIEQHQRHPWEYFSILKPDTEIGTQSHESFRGTWGRRV